MKKSLQTGLEIGGLVVIAAVAYMLFSPLFLHCERNRGEVRALCEGLQLGATSS